MDMAFGAAQDTSSSLAFLIRSDGFEAHQHEAVVFIQGSGQFFTRAEEKSHDESFEQAARDVSVGLVVMAPAPVDGAHLAFQWPKRCCLQVVQQQGVKDVVPAGIGFVGGEIDTPQGDNMINRIFHKIPFLLLICTEKNPEKRLT